MQLDEGDRSPSSSSSTSQCRAEKQVLSGTATPDDCLSIRSLSSRVSVQGPGDLCASPKTAAPAREHSALQRHISEAQTLIMEVDTCIQDSFQTRVQEDVLTRAVIESLMQQNQAVAQELDLQTARVHELEVMLADAYEQKAVAVSESQTAMEELQDFIRGRDKLLKELSEDYSQLREEKIHLQSFFCDDGHGTAVLKKSFHQSHPQINKMQGEITELHRRQHTSSLSKLYLGLKAHEERELSPQDVASVVLDLNEFSSFLGGTLDEQHQNSAPEPGPAAAEGATRLRKEYKTQTFKV
ncbi:uncharacterized protein LOC133130881 [Conger conger]|uniref:uncharacterized protein LOC133130881 n=1 Tax=Conger conger TaxID=82655 RepID=UPI002A5AE1FB|nr:uncharacterized protein LOC133130881 [Conger conger]XP_061101817.1 uncharacterized protein LOC133130881 [Conger conger]